MYEVQARLWLSKLLGGTDISFVSDEEIKEHMMKQESSEAIVRGFVNLVLERGGTDNVTVVMLRIKHAS